jgi:hypothetical protein
VTREIYVEAAAKHESQLVNIMESVRSQALIADQRLYK